MEANCTCPLARVHTASAVLGSSGTLSTVEANWLRAHQEVFAVDSNGTRPRARVHAASNVVSGSSG